jgi:peptidyl-dipeptidase A
MKHPFEAFLEAFIPKVALLQKRTYKLLWILETTGSKDASDLKAELDTELKLLFHDPKAYEQLLKWEKDPEIEDPLLKRQLKLLLFEFKKNQLPEELLHEISVREANIVLAYGNFRAECEGKKLSENQILDLLENEEDPEKRKKAWEASKQIGSFLAPQILELVELRNRAAKSLGYPDFFQMQLELQEVNQSWLLETFETLGKASNAAYNKVLEKIEQSQMQRFRVSREELGPWAWNNPFCQEDPIDAQEIDTLVENVDLVQIGTDFFDKMGFDVRPILARSDMYEKEGKNQHAFCINIDRDKDIRTLNNVRPTIKWLETVLHELGHAVYELGYDSSLPWLLREPPHMLTTEAMALLCGRQAYRLAPLKQMLPNALSKETTMRKAEEGLRRRQLIFSRWVMVMTEFERALYSNPKQNLNALWWSLVEKHQKIRMPKGREECQDWAAKVHIGMAPVYYFSYLLGEMYASALHAELSSKEHINTVEAGKFFREYVFKPGCSLSWDKLVEHSTKKPLSCDAWLEEFATNHE